MLVFLPCFDSSHPQSIVPLIYLLQIQPQFAQLVEACDAMDPHFLGEIMKLVKQAELDPDCRENCNIGLVLWQLA